MNPRLPPLAWLRAFEAAARHLSFTHAAAELNLTQAAVSKQVKLLEHFLREPLFYRKPRSLELSRVGAAYLPKVRDAFERLTAGTEEVFGQRRSEVLTIRASAGFAVNWIAPRLNDFFVHHPTVRIRFVSSIWAEDFDQQRYDLDINYGTGKWPGFRADRLTWEILEPLAAPGVAAKIKTPADLADVRLLHVIGYAEGWALWLKAAGVEHINSGQGIQFDTSLMAFEVAACGGGVALGRSSMSAKEIASGRLVRPFGVAIAVEEAFHLISPDDGNEHPHAQLFRDWLIGEAHAARIAEQGLPLAQPRGRRALRAPR